MDYIISYILDRILKKLIGKRWGGRLKSPHTKVAIGLLILAVTLSVFTAGCFESSSNTKMEVNEVSPQVNTQLENAKAKIPKAKNVIIFIGDGMGINQVYLANRYSEEVYGKKFNIPIHV